MQNRSNPHKYYISPQFFAPCPIPCLKNQHAKNKIVSLIAFFTIALQRGKVKGSHAKINRIFPHNKNASTELHNQQINKNLVYF